MTASFLVCVAKPHAAATLGPIDPAGRFISTTWSTVTLPSLACCGVPQPV